MSKFMPSNTPFQIDESVGGRWLIVSPETRPTPWGGLIQCHSYADAEAKRDALNGVVRRVTEPRDAEIARLTAEVERLRGGIDLIADERNRLAKRVADLESYMRLILHRCDAPARPGQVCHENPAEIARQALGGGA